MGDVTMGTAQRRRPELAAFLRTRRARVTPDDIGMPPGLRRRTPGLRREEVAQLSGVGVTWYTWLEQGRPINASAQVLDAVARTLRLGPPEREHLYHLAEVPYTPAVEPTVETVSPEMRVTVDALDPHPAVVYNGRRHPRHQPRLLRHVLRRRDALRETAPTRCGCCSRSRNVTAR
jgi:transcriptional regulator with XRE-family HTH domain